MSLLQRGRQTPGGNKDQLDMRGLNRNVTTVAFERQACGEDLKWVEVFEYGLWLVTQSQNCCHTFKIKALQSALFL